MMAALTKLNVIYQGNDESLYKKEVVLEELKKAKEVEDQHFQILHEKNFNIKKKYEDLQEKPFVVIAKTEKVKLENERIKVKMKSIS